MRTLAVNALRMSALRTAQGRHIEHLARAWSAMDVPFDRILLLSPRPLELPDLDNRTLVESRSFGSRLPLVAWEQAALPARARRAAVLFCPTYNAPVVHRGPMVVANNGIYERTPDEFTRMQRLRSTPIHRLSAKRATCVIANSKQTKRDLVEFFAIDPGHIDVVYAAAADIFFREHQPAAIAAEVSRRVGSDDPYVIFVGKLAKRRNVPNLIEAFAAVRHSAGLRHRLLLVGPNTSQVDLAAISRRLGLDDVVVHIPFLDQEALALLYAGADLFALPTTYEGISRTMFEAMASGTPVLTVDHPTVWEGADGAAFIAPTASVDDLAESLARLLCDAEFRADLSARGRAKARTFTWQSTATRTLEILDRVAASRDAVRGR